MAKEKRKFNKNFALMCIVPVLVLVVTMSIMGVTFAWFNEAEQTTIAKLSLSTTQTFKMTFDIGAELNETKYEDYQNQLRYIYKGQTAYDKEGLLVTPVHAIEHYGYEDDSLQYKNYLNDKAFEAPFALKLDTNGYAEDGKTIVKEYAVDFNCVIESVHIYNSENQAIEIKLPNDGKPDDPSDDITPDDIKLGFTWYISGGQEGQWYTPYGRVYSTTPTNPNGENPNYGTIVNDDDSPYDWDTNRPTTAFNSNVEGSNFTFNIVFAPEKLFWKQYGSVDDYNQTASDVYGDLFKSDKWNAINRYSSIIYSGSTYSFTVLLTVTTVTEVE